MELEDEEEYPIGGIHRDSVVHRERLEVLVEHHEEDGALHEQPAHLVVHTGAPLIRTHLAVAGIDEIEGYKHDEAYQKHDKQQVVKEINSMYIHDSL